MPFDRNSRRAGGDSDFTAEVSCACFRRRASAERIYRNLYFHEIETAQSRGLRHISLGTTVDEFKLRIGSKPRGRIIYVKVGGWLQAPFQFLAKYFMPEIPTPAAKNVFRENRMSTPPRLRKAA